MAVGLYVQISPVSIMILCTAPKLNIEHCSLYF